ncbi:M23 family metallopeptidase [Bacillus sp. 165]|uniref:M23 family metallopeptidase n=1 Tax=Bacillus sp. 165 TaxID=1529117 RepID=UPI001ADC3990|nr:M23 family metallopeptidase [Bacillus sp. 165]
MWKKLTIILILINLFLPTLPASAEVDKQKIYQQRMSLYKEVELISHIPWHYFAAIDQYERNVRSVRRDIPKKQDGVISIYFKPEIWSGSLNPNQNDKQPFTIALFGGIGLDGDNDGYADQNNDRDLLYTMANIIGHYGNNREHIKIMLWEHYKRAKTVELITGFSRMYAHYGKIDIEGNAFPVPISSNHSYRSTFGARRSFGGLRSHEGTDIFAGYGVPVRATCYGIIETKGWNRLGGWRIGIRDLHNNYHYYAHLGGFSKDVKLGQIVEPGTVVGFVGSSGYGPPGTAGKFPPHLHYGLYKDNGYTEWSFDPYIHLRLWKQQELMRIRKK